MNKRISDQTKYYLALACIIAFHIIFNFIWLKGNKVPPAWDEARHLTIGLNYARSFPSLFINRGDPYFQIGAPFVYGPLVYFLSAMASFVLGATRIGLTSINFLFIVVLLISTFKIGQILANGRVGVLSAFIVSLYPVIFGSSRLYILDYAITAMAALSLYMLIKTDHFTDKQYVILFGISVALGLFIKLSFMLFVVGPLLYTIVTGIKGHHDKRIVSVNLAVFMLIAWAAPLIWYAANNTFPLVLNLIAQDPFLRIEEYLRISFIAPFRYYFNMMQFQIGWFGILIFILAVSYFIFKKGRLNDRGFLLSWIAIPLLIYYAYMEYPRYTMSYLPAIALFSAAWIAENWKKAWVKALSILFVSGSLFLFLVMSGAFLRKTEVMKNLFLREDLLSWTVYSPEDCDWQVENVLGYINRHDNGKEATVGLLVDTATINNETFAYYAYLRRFPLEIVRCIDIIKDEYFDLDYLITLKDPTSWHWKWRDKNTTILKGMLENDYSAEYALVKEFPLYEGNAMYLYKKL